MKLPNGFGTVYKLKGNRRKPYIAIVSQKYIKTSDGLKRKRNVLGYYITKEEALIALAKYHENPYDLEVSLITFEKLYEKWSEEHFKKLSNKSSMRTYQAAFNHSTPLHKMSFKNIRPSHLEGAIESAEVGTATKARMKSMYNLMYRYALKYDIVDKNYAELCNSVKVEKIHVKVPFTAEEVQQLWEVKDEVPFVDMILVGLYSGFRPIELTMIKKANVYLSEGYIIGGTKTKAGTNRMVPIHPRIKEIIEKRCNTTSEYLFNDYNMFEGEICSLTYDKYRNRFEKVMRALRLKHNPHETRHSFITQAKQCNVDDYMLKRIIGHEISDITEKVYTHRNIDELRKEIAKIEY